MHPGPKLESRPVVGDLSVGEAVGTLALALAREAGFKSGVEELVSGVREASEAVVLKGPVVLDVMDVLLVVMLLKPELVDGGSSGVLPSESWIFSEIRTAGRQ